MIYNYEIKKYGKDEILYLYLDFNDEFASLKWKDKKEKLENKVKEFIKENKIDFVGDKVAIIVGGLVVGTLLLTTPIQDNQYDQKLENYEIGITETITENSTSEEVVQDTEEKEEVQEQVEENQDSIQNHENAEKETTDEIKTETQIDSKVQEQVTTGQAVVQQPVQNTVQTEQTVEQPTQDIQQEQVIPEQNLTYVTVYRANGTVVTLELEEYLIGVVGAEMPAAFHDQALKSQAVIARTYALKALERNITLTDDSRTQNYKSNDELRSLWGSSFDMYYSKIKNAVEQTKDQYLTYNGQIIEAVYHSTSNGRTEDSKNVWGNAFPYLVSVESSYDSSNPSFASEKLISYGELTTKLGTEININTNFNILSKTVGNRVENIEINGQIYNGVTIRNTLGLRSADFEIEKTNEGVIFRTKGYGHGVGLSQYGANGMAKNGYTYDQILKHYYSGVTLSFR